MKRPALIIALLFCAAAVRAQAPAVTDCGATPAADACVAKPKNTDIFGLPIPAARASRAAETSGPPMKLPYLIDDTGPAEKAGPRKAAKGKTLPAAAPAAAPAEVPAGLAAAAGAPDLSRLERASNALHLWLGLALALLALSEAFAADNPGRVKISLAGCALSAALALGALAAAALALGPSARELLAFRPGFLLYYAAALLAASAALSQLLSRGSGGGGFWGGAAAFFRAAAGAVLLAVHTRVNPEAATAVLAGHVPVGAALLAAGAARAFLLFSSAAPPRAALAVFLFIAAAMSGLYKESPNSFSPHFSTVTEAGTPPGGAEEAATGRTNEEAADKKGPRG